MKIARIEVRNVAKKLSTMEHIIIENVKARAAAGHDHLFMRLFIEEELKSWKKRDKYRHSQTKLDVRSEWEMFLVNGKDELALFKTVIMTSNGSY